MAKLGFIVLPYIHADPVLCKHLESAGTAAVMPLGSQSSKAEDYRFSEIIIMSNVPVIVDAELVRFGRCKSYGNWRRRGIVNTAIAVSEILLNGRSI
ncbi:hypothetical protein CS542_01065 [Pedobacter sp. IW39]|nr:hypothetical protein CS542_01065 [Pedobacter sp. IW39]